MSIIIKNLGKKFNDFEVLKDITLTIEKNQINSIVGLNGSGKTTLLKCIGTLLEFDTGNITYNLKNKRNIRKNISFLSAGTISLYNQLTVCQNIRYFLEIKKVKIDKKKQDEIDYFLDLFNLTSKKNSILSKLSTGMKQKIAIIISITQNTEILLLDEPSLGLDFDSLKIFKEILLNLKKEKIIINTSHDINLIEDISDRLIILSEGALIYEGDINNFKNVSPKISISIILNLPISDNLKTILEVYSNDLNYQNNILNGSILKKDLNDFLEKITSSDYKILNLETNNLFKDNFDKILTS